MKLKSILALTVVMGVTLFATSVYAATTSYYVGTPIDLKTNQPVEEYEVGQIVALPVDFESESGYITATGISLNFDTNVLEYGADLSAVTSDTTVTANLLSLGVPKYNSNSSKVMLVNGLYTSNILTGNTEIGMMNVPDEADSGKVKIPWANATEVATSDAPELYIIFTVVGTISSDSLNVEIVSVNNEECNIGNNAGNVLNVSGVVDKANACDGAFQVVFDTDALAEVTSDDLDGATGYYVQGVTATINGKGYPLEACVQDGSTVYKFPVRLTSEAEEASVNVTITATVTDYADGSGTERTVEWGTVNVDMSGTVTSYASADASVTGTVVTTDTVAE